MSKNIFEFNNGFETSFDTDYINKVGVEIEGFFNDVPQYSSQGKFVLDGSVIAETSDENNYPYIGEVVSKPMNSNIIGSWIEFWYPNASNWSCGLHVHISLKDERLYEVLRTVNFYDFYRLELQKFIDKLPRHEHNRIFGRFKGCNEYCFPIPINEFEDITQKQMLATEKTEYRYFDLNFCKNLHGTIECRVFPVFYDVSTAITAVKWFIDTVNKYLSNIEKSKAEITKAFSKQIVRDNQVIADINFERHGNDLILRLKSVYIAGILYEISKQDIQRSANENYAYYTKLPDAFSLARECKYDIDIDIESCCYYGGFFNFSFFTVVGIGQGKEFRCQNDLSSDQIVQWIKQVENWFEKYIL